MTRLCNRFDQYRDGELPPAEQALFERHLEGCGECALRARLLDNLVRALDDEEPTIPAGFARRVAARAFARTLSWDELLLSWLPPRQIWVATTLALCIFAALMVASSRTVSTTSGQYELLIEQSEKLVNWGNIQSYADFRAVAIQRGESYD
jgi:anti-sigma factor RsiW